MFARFFVRFGSQCENNFDLFLRFAVGIKTQNPLNKITLRYLIQWVCRGSKGVQPPLSVDNVATYDVAFMRGKAMPYAYLAPCFSAIINAQFFINSFIFSTASASGVDH